MKVIITGATGLTGGAVVRQSIANDRITHAYVLTRKPLPEALSANPKVTVITHDDFSSYPAKLLDQLVDAEGCIWCIGGRATQFKDVETCRKVQVDMTLAAAKAFVTTLAPKLAGREKKFRFVFCSGMGAEWDQDKSLMFLSDTRKIKGQAEKGLCDIADANPDLFEVWCARPSGILPSDAGVLSKATGKLYNAISADRLAASLVGVFLDGHQGRIIENSVLTNGQGA